MYPSIYITVIDMTPPPSTADDESTSRTYVKANAVEKRILPKDK
jgi:hypothetical protein